jgi:cardiolipin synthase
MSDLWQALQSPLVWAVLLLWLAYLLWLAGWIVLQKREPIATLSWLLSLAFLPVLGLLIYHLLGPQRIQRQRLKRSRARARLECSAAAAANANDISALQRLAQASGRYAPGYCDRVQLLVDGAATFDALVAAIASARWHVHLEYYIFEPDFTGTRLRDALIERAAAGVTVRLLMDALGSWHVTERFLAPLREAGAEVAFVHRFRLRRLWRRKINLRNHRKIVVVDGRIGFTGGVNIADEQNERVNANAYHDVHLRMDGEAVQWLQLAFVEDWAYATSCAIKEPELWPALAPGPIRTQVLPAGPDSPWETIHRVQLAAIYQARHRIWLATPYFIPGEAARMALTSAALRGVEVRILVPECSDSYLTTLAARSYFDELISAGAHVLEYQGMLHTKALLIDDDICILGSSNFDYRSFRLSFELCVMFEDAEVTGALAAILSRDLIAAKEVAGARNLAFRARLAEAGARLLSPLL